MRENKKLKILFLLFLILLFGGVNSVLALEINYPRLPGTAPPQDFVGTAPAEQIVSLYALYIFNLTIWLAGAIALGALIYAGIIYLISAGKPERMTSAREQITGAFFGIMLLLSSYIVLQILNPQLTVLEIPKLEPVKIIERPEISPPPTELHRSAINTETPFANIIEERIFATSTMAGIKKNALTTLEVAKKLEELSEDLKNKVSQCSCPQTQSICTPCVTKPPSTSDPCDNVRGDIEGIQQDIVNEIGKLTGEQKKTAEEIRLLREELAKLERAETFMLQCQLAPLGSLAEFLGTKNYYSDNKWLFLDIKFWDQILTVEDWANFYCPVSGTVWGRVQYTPTEEISPVELPEEITLEPMACLTEAPVGDVIDRAKRTGYLLAKRLEALLQKGDELIEAVAKMQVSVSECSSRRCTSVCVQTKKGCIKLPPVGVACPSVGTGGIKDAVKEIEKIVKEGGKEEIGIVPIIEKVVPKILEDLEKEVRQPMKACITEISPDRPEELPAVLLSNCDSALGAIGPKGIVIENCCLQEPQFKECLQECYLEEGQEKYKQCLGGCLKKKSEELRALGKTRESEIIATCRNRINFYCCGK